MSDPRARLVPLLERLIAFPTHNPDGDEAAMCAYLAEALAVRGADEVAVRPLWRHSSVLARWGTPRLLINAHIDTVPPNAGWSQDPFVPRGADGRLYGLGAADTKGAIASILDALEEVRPRDTLVVFSGDEELTGTCLRDFIGSPAARGLTQAIVCEPTSCRAGTRHRGVVGIEARLGGQGGHSSRADALPAPLAELARLAVAWHEWGRARAGQGPPGFLGMCANVAKLEGGVAFNVVPENATLTFSLRPPPGADSAALDAELKAIAARVVPGAEVRAMVANPPFATRDLAAFGRLLGPAVGQPIDLAFWTEAAILAEAGIDAVVYGPGDIAQAHAPDEWVTVDDLVQARAAFAALFRETHAAG